MTEMVLYFSRLTGYEVSHEVNGDFGYKLSFFR